MKSESAPKRIAILSDGSLLGQAVEAALQNPEWDVQTTTGSVLDALNTDVVVLVARSDEFVRTERAHADPPLVIVVPDDDPRWLAVADRLRARAAVAASDRPEVLLRAVAAAAEGHVSAERPRSPPLTSRERAVVDLLERGESDRRIAAHLGLTEPTVRSHVRSACRKLGERTRSGMLETYRRDRASRTSAEYERPLLREARALGVALIAPPSIRRDAVLAQLDLADAISGVDVVDPDLDVDDALLDAIDVAIVDGASPSARAFTQRYRATRRSLRYVVTAPDDASPLASYLEGADAHLSYAALTDIGVVIQRVALGDCVIPDGLQRRLVTEVRVQTATSRALATDAAQLSRRERSVIELLARGLDEAGIAELLGIAASTVHSHLQNASRKTGRWSRNDLVTLGKYLASSTAGDATADS